MAWPLQVAEFVLLLGGLVFFHELGHFLVAKACNVKVLKFSLGFGRKLVGITRGETEYQIAMLPLGGYVKMLGEDPSQKIEPADRGRGFSEQAPWKRAAIAFAGPGFNLILPPMVFFAINLVPHLQDPPVVAVVLPNEPADRAGIEPRDRIVSIDGIPTRSFEEMKETIEARAGQRVDVVVMRHGEQKTLQVTPSSESEKSPVETTHKGKIGIVTGQLPSYVGVVPNSRAWQAGVRSFDRIVGVNGQKVTTVTDLDDAVKKAGSAPLHFDIVRGNDIDLKTASISTAKTLAFDIPSGASPLGLDSADLYVNEVEPGSPAETAGLKVLDKVVSAQGKPVFSAMRLEATIVDEKNVALQVDRAGQRIDVSFTPAQVTRKDKLLGPVSETDYGFRFHPGTYATEPFAPSERVLVSYSIPQAATRAVKETGSIMRTMVLGIGALFMGRVPASSVGSVFQMYDLVKIYGQRGVTSLLTIFALISVNLGLINLLPVPVLDGFHIVIATVEGISKRTVPLRAREIANSVGLFMLLALMLFAVYNDIHRKLGM